MPAFAYVFPNNRTQQYYLWIGYGRRTQEMEKLLKFCASTTTGRQHSNKNIYMG